MSATYLKNNNNIKKALKRQLFTWMHDLKEKLPDYLEEFIMSEYYEQYSPVMHERQFRILSAIMTSDIVDVGDGYEFEIYLDPDKVSYDPSFWTSHGITYYMRGDNADAVFHNMANGIHGSKDIAVTSGRFWNEFLNEIGEGGIYDIFVDFKKYFESKCGLTIQ